MVISSPVAPVGKDLLFSKPKLGNRWRVGDNIRCLVEVKRDWLFCLTEVYLAKMTAVLWK